MLCEYGCGQEAKFVVRKTHNCCESAIPKCPAIRVKNSVSMKDAYSKGQLESTWKKYYSIPEKRKEILDKRHRTIEEQRKNSKFDDLSSRIKKEVLLAETNGRCFKCKGLEWMGELLNLQRHHKDGNPKNNKKENLEYLCPNCHSLTENFGRKGRTPWNKRVL